MAMWATSRAQYPKAIEYLNGALAAFTTDEETMSGLERTVRYRLVDAYERLGEREAATEHCLAVGARQKWSLPPSPLYGIEAVYPAEALDKGLSGEVRLSFTIDEKGYVADATVAQSSETAFDEAALEMIRQYRYAPRFVDGKPVATDGVQVTAVFDSAKQRSGPFKADFNLPALPGFQGPRPDDPAVCGDINDPTIAGRCQGFGNRK
jgi:TonB family protein